MGWDLDVAIKSNRKDVGRGDGNVLCLECISVNPLL